MKQKIQLWVAQGFGAGRIPFAPGTFGSVVGLLWFAVLLAPHSLSVYLGGMVLSFGVSVWLCGEGEKILQQKDPGSIVLDEIVALPLCFLWVIGLSYRDRGELLTGADFWDGNNRPGCFLTLGVFVAFRIFDVWKPWPVRPTQNLPGGWGVTVDDLMAAGYVNFVGLIYHMLRTSFPS